MAASTVYNPVYALDRSMRALDNSILRSGTFIELRRGVGAYTDQGGTIGWMIRKNLIVVVDTQYERNASSNLSSFEERADSSSPFIDLLINTHHHGDHTGGNRAFLERSQVSVAHRGCVDLQRANAENGDAPVATTSFEETWAEDVGDETVRLMHDGPAHTGGDATVFFEKANVVHTGDLVFNHVVPFIDIDGGASIENWIVTLEDLHARFDDDTRFIFGHGGPDKGITGSRAGLLQMRDYLTALSEFVREKRVEGVRLEELTQTTDLPGFEEYSSEDWPLPLAQNLEAAYREQTGG